MDRHNDQDGLDYCDILIGGNNKSPNRYILGDIFLFNNYVVMDYDNKRVGINGEIVIVENVDKHENPQTGTGQLPLWAIILIMIVFLGIFLGIIAFVFIRYKYRRLHDELSIYDNVNETVKE